MHLKPEWSKLEKVVLARRIGKLLSLPPINLSLIFTKTAGFTFAFLYKFRIQQRCLKKYCACVTDGLPCDDDRCSCNECENTVLARMSRRSNVSDDLAGSVTKLVADDRSQDVKHEKEDDAESNHTEAETAAATHEASFHLGEQGHIVIVPMIPEELTPGKYPTIEV